MAQRLTDAQIKRLAPPAQASRIIYDAVVPGFGARITAAGARSFVLNYRTKLGRERRLTIGSTAHWRVTEARAEARKLKQRIDQGGDPLAELEAEREAPTLMELVERFKQEHLPRLRPSTRDDYARLLLRHVAPILGAQTKVAAIRFEDIDALHRRVTEKAGPFIGNRCVAVVSKMMTLAVRWHVRESNPCRGVEHNRELPRQRYLSNEELPRLTAALTTLADRQAADVIRLLLLTGARKGEVLAAKWADIDLTEGRWSKPGHSTKQQRDHIAPLNGPARALLSRIREAQDQKNPHRLPTFVFPGRYDGHREGIRRAWDATLKAAHITGLRIHDLRHSYASLAVGAGFSLPIIGSLLGHSVPATTQRYAHLSDSPLRVATERVGALIENAGQPPSAEVIKLKSK